jgi:glycosyltransferase involved in cell wall biosynthesis
MRVAVVTGPATGGMARHARMLAGGLGVPVRELGTGSRPRAGDARVLLRLRRELPESADVVHAHGLRAGALCALALAGTAGRPALVVTVHNAPPPGRSPAALVYRLLERIVARAADLVLCVSPDLERRARKAGARHVAAAVVPAPAPTPAGPPPAGRPRPGRPVVLAAGRLAPQKGFGALLAAAASWRDMDPVPRVVIAGEGPLGPQLRAQAAALGVDAEFLGHRDDVPALLEACDVFVLPSRWEGQPLVLQEALRAGAAIVATNAGGIPGLTGPEAACLVRPGDVPQLAAAVRAVLTSGTLAARLRTAARRRAADLPAEADALAAALASYAEVTPLLLVGAAFQATWQASWRASPALKMFTAAFTSAWAWWPQARHRNSAWVTRLPSAVCPHSAHCCEV